MINKFNIMSFLANLPIKWSIQFGFEFQDPTIRKNE